MGKLESQSRVACSQCKKIREKTGKTYCSTEKLDNFPKPKNCPTENEKFKCQIAESLDLYKKNREDCKLSHIAAKVEGLGYSKTKKNNIIKPRFTRVEETIVFAKLMGYKKIGIGTCIGLLNEAYQLEKIFRAQEFEVFSICCKVGGIDKSDIDIPDEFKIRENTFEAMCNPIAQAKILNKLNTDLNIIVGLCVGHDILFTKYSNSPVTTLVVKDRVTGHNPAAVLYNQSFYYSRLHKEKIELEEA